MSEPTATLQILLLTLIVFTVSGDQKLTITPDRGTTLNLISSQDTGCRVCTGAGRLRECYSSLTLRDDTPVSVDFECSRPQDAFSVEILRNIECTAKSCSSHIIQAESSSLPLLDFNRKFTWTLKASPPKAFKIDFTSAGLSQINPSERCPDKHSYTLQALQTTGVVTVGRFCRVGPVSSAQILNQGRFSVEVPAGQKLQNGQFSVSVGEEIKSLAKITVTLPKGTSSAELLSPNYPASFPDDDVMEWYFQVPDNHKTAVQLSKLTQPLCLKKLPAVEYHSTGRGARVLRLMDPQPDQSEGSFSLKLRNCEMDRRRAGSPGLSLSLKVSSSSKSSSVLCNVDVSRLEGLALHIEKQKRPASDCVMKINSAPTEKITLASNGELHFQDCLPEDVRVTATRLIGCHQLKDCPKTPLRLPVPPLPACLPFPLSSVTWTLRVPQDGTVELASPLGPLKQCLPVQPCNDSSLIIKLAEDDGTTVGRFCPQGAIQKIQSHTNVSVTVSGVGAVGGKGLRSVLNVLMKEEISERFIFTVSPKRDTPVFLATPGWPVGMKDYSVSWMVSVPERMEARVMINASQPKCNKHHTSIKVQKIGCLEEDYSRREDEKAESEITVTGSFYLNMSNCMTESGEFSSITKVTLQKSRNLLLTIILSVVAALLAIFVIVLVVVCVVIRKKKKNLNFEESTYNPNGTSFLPGQNGVPGNHEDGEHEYASIDETLVYTHLLRNGEMEMENVSVYRPFEGHTDSRKPLVSKESDGDSMQDKRASAQQAPPLPVRPLSHDKVLVDNVIYKAGGQSEDERSPDLGPRMEPEGGDGGADWI